ncbi:MAG: mercuric reductase [Betaproteobacteria bacterium RIFCSPLOWO2_02_FULL_65_24]|nr:MAG: mercuric reductase [Betaproteobacteria bacterium RIFCSPLOWO2_02_FULL_65_24]
MSKPGPERYDAIVIGSGQAGSPLATAFARAGLKAALVERAHVGGTCVNVGCTPSKTMFASARVAYLARRAPEYGIRTGTVNVDLERVRQRTRAVVQRFRDKGTQNLKEAAGLALLFGHARFRDARTVEVRLHDGAERILTAPAIFIDTGSSPRRPDLPGIDRLPVLDSTSIMELTTVPEHLLVLGGGTVGVEFAQMFRRFGSRVSIVERGPQLLPQEDRDVAAAVAEILRQDGVDVFLESSALEARRNGNGRIALRLRFPHGERTLTGSHLLIAAGRTPNTEALDLAAAGVTVDDRGYIRVNERLETNVPGIYALGEVRGAPPFTHFSYDDFRIIRTNLLENGAATVEGKTLCYTVFIDPQLGRLGLTETEARKQRAPIRVAKLPFNRIARAVEADEERGFLKVILDAGTGQILGAAVLGMEGGEMMAMLQIAMMGRIAYPVLRDAIFAHPTLAEALNNVFVSLDSSEMEAQPQAMQKEHFQ